MTNLETQYPLTYTKDAIGIVEYSCNMTKARTALYDTQHQFVTNPSASNWLKAQQAMFDYQQLKLNARDENHVLMGRA